MYVFAVVLIAVCLLGWISDFTLDGFSHLFLLAAVILIVFVQENIKKLRTTTRNEDEGEKRGAKPRLENNGFQA